MVDRWRNLIEGILVSTNAAAMGYIYRTYLFSSTIAASASKAITPSNFGFITV